VLGPDGERLAKRHGAVTLRDVLAADARAWMLESLRLPADVTAACFDPAALPDGPTRFEGVSHRT